LPILLFIGIKDYELSRGHLSVAISLEGLALTYLGQKVQGGKKLYERAIGIMKKRLTPNDPNIVRMKGELRSKKL